MDHLAGLMRPDNNLLFREIRDYLGVAIDFRKCLIAEA
jgi:hypothetical protein